MQGCVTAHTPLFAARHTICPNWSHPLSSHTHVHVSMHTHPHTHTQTHTPKHTYRHNNVHIFFPHIPQWQWGESLRVCHRHAYICALSCPYSHTLLSIWKRVTPSPPLITPHNLATLYLLTNNKQYLVLSVFVYSHVYNAAEAFIDIWSVMSDDLQHTFNPPLTMQKLIFGEWDVHLFHRLE